MSAPATILPDARALSLPELEAQLGAWGEPAFRGRQIMAWLYQHQVEEWSAMSNLPGRLRERLNETYSVRLPVVVTVQGSRDSTAKFLWRLHDGSLVESVLIPASEALYGEPSDRRTLCVSTQVGCAYGCRFCASGLDGFRRNLRVEEIVGQVVAVERWYRSNSAVAGSARSAVAPPPSAPRSREHPTRIVSNLVIMGMGEPLANYDHLLKALRILNSPWGAGIGARKITVSTSGLAPQILRLAGEPEQFRLAISLHAASNAVRDSIMPVNRKYPIEALSAACEEYLRRKGRMITLEYILIAGVNDRLSDAKGLAFFARRLSAKVNLIPYNPVGGLQWERPATEVSEAFLDALLRGGAQATLRREKGVDIEAACGQLRLRVERAERGTP